tara:strand:+ start:85 stop:444 length:360 start_codon:yes stop_codon:yes gene_type:complete
MGTRLTDIVFDKTEDDLYEDNHSMILTHYAMAERCMLMEYDKIKTEMNEEGSSDTLIYILEGGFTGFHDMEPSELIKEYEEVEDRFYTLYKDNELPYDLYSDDPLVALEEDENGEVEHA